MMRLFCFYCGKSVTNEIQDDTIFRAIATCPECIDNSRPLESSARSEGEAAGYVRALDELKGKIDNSEHNLYWDFEVTDLIDDMKSAHGGQDGKQN